MVSIDGYDETIWKKEEKRLHVVSSGQGNLVFESEKYNFSMEAFVYRPLLMCDEQIIEIKYQQQSQPWGSIGLLFPIPFLMKQACMSIRLDIFVQVIFFIKIEDNRIIMVV